MAYVLHVSAHRQEATISLKKY